MPFAPEILSLDLEPIAYIAAVEYGWSLEETDAAELKYRAFLQAILDYPEEPLAPSRDCDLFWHMHVLDTRRYWSDCMRIFGRFIHHFPYSGLQGADDLKQQRRRFARSQRIIGRLTAELRNHFLTHSQEQSHEANQIPGSSSHPRRPHRLHSRARPSAKANLGL